MCRCAARSWSTCSTSTRWPPSRGCRAPVRLAMAALLGPGVPPEFEEGRRRAVEEVLANRPGVQVRWYESRHDIPLIRPDELATDVERTALAAELASLVREAAALDGDWRRPVHGDGGGREAHDLLAHPP